MRRAQASLPSSRDHKVSVIVPARNEAGHIAEIVDRIPVEWAVRRK